MAEPRTLLDDLPAAWRLRTQPGLTEAQRIQLVSEAITDIAEREGVTASEINLRAAESYVIARTTTEDAI